MKWYEAILVMLAQAVILFIFLHVHGYKAILQERVELEKTRLKYTQQIYQLIVNRSYNQVKK